MKKTLFSFILITFSLSSSSHKHYGIIPEPHQTKETSGTFKVNKTTSICIDPTSNPEMQSIAFSLADFFLKNFNTQLPIISSSEANANTITLKLDSTKNAPKEGYQLCISRSGINIIAHAPIGIFWGIQSLQQLILMNTKKPSLQISIPGAIITDSPRFSYRGLHLDVSRHMFSVSNIKKIIDLMAFYKLNTFHWHLTDDQGWRIEIKKYPRLHKIGGYRTETLIGHKNDFPPHYDGTRYGGYYTQDQILEIVDYAHSRYIQVIPEVELPGHCLAALAAYPELGCTGGPYETAKEWGPMHDIFCVGSEKVFSFLEDVLTEVMEIFPSPYIHIGGDEVIKERWKNCPKCQARMKKEKLRNENELQSYFIQRIEKFLNAHGKQIIGWDEILEGKLSGRATVMSWRGVEGGIESARKKHNAIMTPCKYLYFDYYQNDRSHEPLAIGGYIPLSKVYEYEPIPAELSAQQASFILGIQANVWTEYIKTMEHLEYMIFPRALALAEIAWSIPENKNYARFIKKVDIHLAHLKRQGVNCARYAKE